MPDTGHNLLSLIFILRKEKRSQITKAQEVTRSLLLQQETSQPDGTFRSNPENSPGPTGNCFFKGKGDNTG